MIRRTMGQESELSPSGVRIARNFRSNLIIDRYDPVFADMRASKIKHLRSVNSDGAITWNVFRLLMVEATRVPLGPTTTVICDDDDRTPIFHRLQEFYVGSMTVGVGKLLQTNKLQRYRGTAKHTDRVSPVSQQ